MNNQGENKEGNVPRHENHGDLTRRDFLKYGSVALGAAAAATGAGQKTFSLIRTPARHFASASSGTTLNAWTWAGANLVQENLGATMKAFPSTFNNVNVNVSLAGSGDQQVAEKLSLTYAAHTTLPDLVQLNATEVPEFAAAGLLADASSYLEPVSADLYAGARNVAQVDGSWVAFPFQLNAKLFYYRWDLFEKAGIDAEAIETVDDFLAAGQKFTAKFPGQHIFNIASQPAQYTFDMVYSAYAPISFYDKAAGKWDVTTDPAFAQTFQFIRQLTSIAYPVDDFTKDWPTAIAKGNICGFLGADWLRQFFPGYAGLAQKGLWRAIQWPKLSPLKDQRYGSDAGGPVYVVPDGAPNKQLALELLTHWITTEQGALGAFGATGFPPMLKTVEPQVLAGIKAAKKPASVTETAWLEYPQNYLPSNYYATEFGAYDFVTVFGFDPSSLKEVFTIAQPWFDKVTASSMSISSILEGMQKDMESQIGNPYTAAA
jgi:ABC-type glycerol-3-phosphate transport system substrate-binding protein